MDGNPLILERIKMAKKQPPTKPSIVIMIGKKTPPAMPKGKAPAKRKGC